ncbi:unnamed protein product, partial [Allacma fusca]
NAFWVSTTLSVVLMAYLALMQNLGINTATFNNIFEHSDFIDPASNHLTAHELILILLPISIIFPPFVVFFMYLKVFQQAPFLLYHVMPKQNTFYLCFCVLLDTLFVSYATFLVVFMSTGMLLFVVKCNEELNIENHTFQRYAFHCIADY